MKKTLILLGTFIIMVMFILENAMADPKMRFKYVWGDPEVTDWHAEGIAFGDYDNDGDQDIYVTLGYSSFSPEFSNRLWENDGNGNLIDVATLRGVDSPGGRSRGASWGDYDNDGDLDLILANKGLPLRKAYPLTTLYQNQLVETGEPNFVDVTCAAGIYRIKDAGMDDRCGLHLRSSGIAWGDYNDDGYLDIYYCNTGADESGGYSDNVLFENNGDGTFTDVTMIAGVGIIDKVTRLQSSGSPNWVDFDNDGDLDLFRTNNDDKNFLFSNNGDGTFKDETEIWFGPFAGLGLALVNSSGNTQGSCWGDIDNDGDMDCYIINIDQADRLVRNNLTETGKADFTDITMTSGVGDMGAARGCTMGDYDNDGDLDIYVNRSGPVNVLITDTNPFLPIATQFYVAVESAINILYSNNGDGTFTDVTVESGAEGFGLARGVASGDVNGDGFLDLFVTQIEAPIGAEGRLEAGLFLNKGNVNNWVIVELVGSARDRTAIGARVKVISGDLTQVREVTSAHGLNSANDQRAHFGLGEKAMVDLIEVVFPSGIVTTLTNPAINMVHTIIE